MNKTGVCLKIFKPLKTENVQTPLFCYLVGSQEAMKSFCEKSFLRFYVRYCWIINFWANFTISACYNIKSKDKEDTKCLYWIAYIMS